MNRVARVLPILALVVAASAGAKPTSIEKQYKAAVKLEVSGDVAAALAAFEAIPFDQRDYNTQLHIAGCKKKLGRLLEAEQAYEAIRTDPKADIATVETAASDLEDVRGRIPRLRVRLTARTSAVVVTIDGVGVTPPLEHRTNPGEHVVLAKRGDVVVHDRRVTLTESATVDVEIDSPVTSPPLPTRYVEVVPPNRTPESSRMSTLPFYIGGAVFAGGAVASMIVALSLRDTVSDNCASQRAVTCNLDEAGASRVRTWEAVAWTSGALAVAAVATGLVIDLGRARTASAALRPSAVGTFGFALEGTF